MHRLLEKDPSRRPYDAAVLLKQLAQDARQAGLLVPKTSVGRWLTNLFEHEKTDEFEEYDRVAAIRHDDVPDRPEGTVVLARPKEGFALEAPMPVQDEDIDSLGTELELSEEEVRSVVDGPLVHSGGIDLGRDMSGRTRPPSPVKTRRRSSKDRPSDVTQAAEVALKGAAVESTDELIQDDDRDEHPYHDDFDEDGMPTRAVTLMRTSDGLRIEGGPGERFGADIQTAPESEPDELEQDESEGPTRYGPIVTPMAMGDETVRPDQSMEKEPETRLPGFLDGAHNTPRVEPPRRRHNPESVIVSPAPLSKARSSAEIPVLPVGPASNSAPNGKSLIAPSSSDPRVRPEPSISGERSPRPQPSPVHGRSQPRVAVHPQQSASRNLLLLGGLLCVAIALGVGIGVVVASLKNGDQVVVVPGQPSLKQRLQRVKQEIDSRRRKGQQVPPDTSDLLADVAAAMVDGDQVEALRKIQAAERLLGLAAQ